MLNKINSAIDFLGEQEKQRWSDKVLCSKDVKLHFTIIV